jgi:hypothetical protein
VAGCCEESRSRLDSGGEGVWVAVEAWERIVRRVLICLSCKGTYIWARGALRVLIHSLWADGALLEVRPALRRWYGSRRSLWPTVEAGAANSRGDASASRPRDLTCN